eukprot:jgi/Botrbrau1/20834/Bobra.0156s0059.1
MDADMEDTVKKTREAAEQSKALDKVTDHVEEKELDQAKVDKAMADLIQTQQAAKEAQRLRERELASVKIDVADVKTIASEFEIDAKAAERRLREHKGDVLAALKSFF